MAGLPNDVMTFLMLGLGDSLIEEEPARDIEIGADVWTIGEDE
jgi:hypothetical protein